MINPALFSSKTDQHATPQDFFDDLNKEFGFTLDVCADHTNAKCAAYYTKEVDGLKMPWVGVVWCNPPYGREIGLWIKKGYESAQAGATVVMLLPSRTDTAYFHDFCLKGELRFVRGRLKFGDATNSAPFPSLVVVFRPQTLK